MVSEIGMGTRKHSGGPEHLLRRIDLGAYLIDTAEMYRNEEAVGKAIAARRSDVILATKVLGRHLRYDQVLRAADESLRRLSVDCIDLYQIHWPNHSIPIAETMQAMEELVDACKVRYIGVSNFSTMELRAAQDVMSKHPIVSNQVIYNLNSRRIEEELLPYCQEHHIAIIAYTPLADGSLATPSRFFPDRRLKVLEQVAAATNRTMAQVALN